MSSHAFTLDGTYFDGSQPVGAPATLSVTGSQAELVTESSRNAYRTDQLKVSPRIASAERFIAFPDGGQLQCADNPALDRLPQKKVEGLAAWLEARIAVAVIGIFVLAAAMISGYVYGLPAAVERAVTVIPVESEHEFGRKGLELLDDKEWFKPTAVKKDIQDAIRRDFDELRKGLQFEPHYRLEFRDAPKLGANALALPGGIVVVTDGLIDLAGTREEVAAVLAHEIGHVESRHVLRMILQDSVVAAVVAAVTGDAATFGVAALPTILAQRSYSRQFESDADEFAFALLKRTGRSPNSFADMMIRLYEKDRKSASQRLTGFIATHPLTRERIDRARAAAEEK